MKRVYKEAQPVVTADGYGGGKLAIPQTIEKQERRNVSRDGLRAKTG